MGLSRDLCQKVSLRPSFPPADEQMADGRWEFLGQNREMSHLLAQFFICQSSADEKCFSADGTEFWLGV
jgi:hypothetical protein